MIDENLTDGSVGCRKSRGARDNIFVISAIISSVLKSKLRPIQVQVIDVITCFDKLWFEACVDNLYEAGVNNDKLNLLFIENRNADVEVKINNKVSKRMNVKNVVMQGSVWGGLMCTNQMDILNKTMKEKEYFNTPPLSRAIAWGA